MFKCVECGFIIPPIQSENSIIECPECRIDLEFFENSLIDLQLGPSKE
jgi:hypothetical protein